MFNVCVGHPLRIADALKYFGLIVHGKVLTHRRACFSHGWRRANFERPISIRAFLNSDQTLQP